MKASLNNYRQSPRKVRAVADVVRGLPVSKALDVLKFADRRAGGPLLKLLNSALASAKESGGDISSLVIKSLTVDGGVTLKRFMPRARGSGYRIKKRTSHISILLGEK